MNTETKENRRIAAGAGVLPVRSSAGGRLQAYASGAAVRRAVRMACGAALLAAALLAAGCSKEPEPEPDVHGEPVFVNFTLDGFAPATRAPLAEGSTVRVIAMKAKTSPPLIPTHEEWVADQAYVVKGDQLKPCKVDAEGANPEPLDNPWNNMRLETGVAYDFHTISPALPLREEDKRALATSVTNGMDYAYSYSRNNTFTDADGTVGVATVHLGALQHKCAGLIVQVIMTEKGQTLRSVRVSGLPTPKGDEAFYGAPAESRENGLDAVTWKAEEFTYDAATFTYECTTPKPVRPILSSLGEAPLHISLTTETSDGLQLTVNDSISRYAISKGSISTIVLTKGSLSGGLGIALTPWELESDGDHIVGGNVYPYVRGGNTVVMRDDRGYGKDWAYHGLWTFTPTHTESKGWQSNDSGLNTVSASFEVASGDCGGSKTYTYDEALTACDGYSQGGGLWRLPTIRELALMADTRSSLTVGGFSNENNYWSATVRDGTYSYACKVISGNKPGWNGKGSYNRVRCIRDL